VNASIPKLLLASGSGGAGLVIAYELVQAVKSEPRMLIAMFQQWGPLFIVCLVGIAVLDRRGAQVIESTNKMAEAMGRLAERDSMRERENELVLNHLTNTNQKIFDELTAIRTEMQSHHKSRGAHG
jgi:uncharacterized membrane protein YcjF (UPF0283 family)